MTDYAPSGFGPTSVIGPHQGLRVTFAQTRSMFTPDSVEAADFRDNVDHLVGELPSLGVPLALASEVTVAPAELAATFDVAYVGSGSISVARATDALYDALYGPLDLLKRTYIRRVQLMGSGGIPWGTPVPRATADAETGLLAVGGVTALVLLVGGVIFFGPEIKAALRTVRR